MRSRWPSSRRGAEDAAAVDAIVRAQEGPEEAELLRQWWSRVPEDFSVARDRDGAVVGFFLLLEHSMLRAPLVRGDPVAESQTKPVDELSLLP